MNSNEIQAFRRLIDWAYAQVCEHEETYRGGTIWEICSQCGCKWADDKGGRPEFKWPEEITQAEQALQSLQSADPVECTLRLSAYYYGFDPTGVPAIDKILSAVAWAGKAFHHTQDWNDGCNSYDGHSGETPVDWIQNAANEAARLCVAQQLGTLDRIVSMVEARTRIRKSGMIDGNILVRDLRSMLSTSPPAPSVATKGEIPEGYKVVPIEPTGGMADAAMNAEDNSIRTLGHSVPFLDLWHAMLKAAPEPPTERE